MAYHHGKKSTEAHKKKVFFLRPHTKGKLKQLNHASKKIKIQKDITP